MDDNWSEVEKVIKKRGGGFKKSLLGGSNINNIENEIYEKVIVAKGFKVKHVEDNKPYRKYLESDYVNRDVGKRCFGVVERKEGNNNNNNNNGDEKFELKSMFGKKDDNDEEDVVMKGNNYIQLQNNNNSNNNSKKKKLRFFD